MSPMFVNGVLDGVASNGGWGYSIVIVIGIVYDGCCAGAQASLFSIKRITSRWSLGLAMFLFLS